jgi:AraC-like DNA-binding protein
LVVNGARRHVAKLAQEFIEEHHHEAVRIEDLCRVTGVGIRTLQRCFREYFDLTITEYLKTVRLDAALRELVAAHPSRNSVSTIAWQHGFTHLGRFSVEFRERFGKLPSEALAMRAGGRNRWP